MSESIHIRLTEPQIGQLDARARAELRSRSAMARVLLVRELEHPDDESEGY